MTSDIDAPVLVWEVGPSTGRPAAVFPGVLALPTTRSPELSSCAMVESGKDHHGQSTSLACVQPVGQHRSAACPEQAVTGTWLQAVLQWAASPVRRSTVQWSPSSGHEVGQLVGGSQVSPAPILPSPHVAAQSESVTLVHPGGQQRSPPRQAVRGAWLQARVQPAAVPEVKSAVQASLSSHDAGQAPGWPGVMPRSQASSGPSTPSPHSAGQSSSLAAVQPGGQHPSPEAQAEMIVVVQRAVQVVAVPASRTIAQAPPGGQEAGQAPSITPKSQ